MEKNMPELSKHLPQNITSLEQIFDHCQDVIKRKFTIGKEHTIDIYISYIDNLVNRVLLEEIIILNLVYRLDGLPAKNKFEYIKNKGLRTADIAELTTMEQVAQSILSGDTVLLIDGYDTVLKIASRGSLGRGVPEASTEVVVRGPKDGFSESIAVNKVLIRRRIRDSRLKVKPVSVGVRSHTDVAILYIEDIVEQGLVEQIEKRIHSFEIDGILDSGMLEQLTEPAWYSPFPQFQSTERPDKASAALLEGRIVLIVDNSPMVLILPTTVNSFFQASDDYYSRWQVVSFIRILRYFAAFIAMGLPGIYIAITNYQSEMIPTSLALSFSAARQGVPFSIVFEVILMELAFELLREAGIRLPGPMGNTIGIVGGLIIGDAAVSANLVSPLIVIVVALTAIASFSIPNEAFASAFRMTRYLIVLLSALLGLFGFILGCMIVLTHLAGLQSFGIPYLMPYVASGVSKSSNMRDALIRMPYNKIRRRPVYARKDQKVRLKKE